MNILRGKRSIFAIILAVGLLVGGCGTEEQIGEETLSQKPKSTWEAVNYDFLEEEDLAWKDNSLDAYHAVLNLPIETVRADGEYFGGADFFAVEGGACRFKNHGFSSYKKNWSGVNGITLQGENFSEVITVETDQQGVMLELLGPVAGGTGYVAYRDEYDENYDIVNQWFYTLNGAFEITGRVLSQAPFGNSLYKLVGDSRGYFHTLVQMGEDKLVYAVFSDQGEKIFETRGSFRGFCRLDDGRVLVNEENTENGFVKGEILLEAYVENDLLQEVAALEWQTIANKTNTTDMAYLIPFVTAKNDKELIYCGREGLYAYHAKEEELEILYLWVNHGISPKEIKDVYAKTDGTIGVVLKDDDGERYLLLQPTTEEVEMKTITFAVNPFHKEAYLHTVTAFNMKYPTYNIVIKDDYEETPLLTQLGAGAGPVLVDTALTGFDGLEKLWQPLDGFLEKSGLAEELIPQAQEFGRIGDRTYGIVSSFFIRTLLVADANLAGWDYEAFLNAIEQQKGSVFSYEFEGAVDNREFFFNSLSNGLDDTLFFDREANTMLFGTPEFERVLILAEKAQKQIVSHNGNGIQNGEALSEIYNVYDVASLVRLRVRMEEEKILAVGYPTKNGAKHMLAAQQPITIRATATDEEKKMAYTFLKMLLSHDCAAKEIVANNNFSIRRDILKEQFDFYNSVTYPMNVDCNDNLFELDREKDQALYDDIMCHSVIKKSFPADLQTVLDEEFGLFFNGEISGDLLDSHLKSRVGLYLDEN